MVYNATLLGKNVGKEIQTNARNFYFKSFVNLCKIGPINSFHLAISKYDFYFDSVFDEISPNGISSRIIFGVFKEGVPVDCKIIITDAEEKTVFFEELVKKKEIPVEILKKERVITVTRYRSLIKDTQEYLNNYYNYENEIEEEKTLQDDKLENNFNMMCTKSSTFNIREGIFMLTYQVDEGNGKKIVAKHLFSKRLNNEIKMGKLFKELGWL